MTISIVIPTLNERDQLPTCLQAIRNHVSEPNRIEIIVVDAGSNDGTIDELDGNVRLIADHHFAGFKYRSLNAGAHEARGDVLLFLDADTLVPRDFDLHIRQTLQDEGVVGGAFEFSFDKRQWPLRVIEYINRFRYRIRQSYYGDQGIFVERSVFNEVGGFPRVRLMEAALLCRQLLTRGRLKLVKTPIITSSRRFVEGGILKVFLFDFNIWMRNIAGLDVERYAEQYWPQE